MPQLVPTALLCCLLAGLVPRPVTAQAGAALSLAEAARRGVEAAPVMEAARSVVTDAAAGVRSARSAWYPSLGVDGSIYRYEEPMIVYPLHALNLTRMPAFDRTLWQSSLVMGYTLFEGGSRGGRISQAEALAGLADDQLVGSRQQTIAAVVRGYVGVLTARAGLAAQDQRLASLQSEGQRVARFLAEGRAARLEQLRVEAATAQARAERTTWASQLDVAERTLARQLALDPDRTRAANLVPVRLRSAPIPDRDSLVARLPVASPPLRMASARVAASRSAVRAASGSWYPTLRVEGRVISYAGGDYSPTMEWQTGLRLSYPLFTGGSRSAQVQRAEASLAEAEARYRDAELATQNRLDQSLAALREAGERVAALQAAVAQWAEVVRTEALALDQGAGTQNDYLRAEADLASSRAALAQAVGAELIARTELALVTGDLTLDYLQTLAEALP